MGILSLFWRSSERCKEEARQTTAWPTHAQQPWGVAAKSANQGGNKVARSGRKIEQNEVPKPGPQNRQFCGDAWAYPHSSKHAVDFPSVRLDCVSFASKTCLDYVVCECIHAHSLSYFARPSLVEVVSLLHNWIHVDFVCASVQIWGPESPNSILGPDLGPILVLVLGFIFGLWTFFLLCRFRDRSTVGLTHALSWLPCTS